MSAVQAGFDSNRRWTINLPERAELDILRGIEQRHWPIIRQMILEVHYPRGSRYDELVELLETPACPREIGGA